MPGLLQGVKTQVKGVTLNVKRLLVMSNGPVILGLYKPDSSQPGGVGLVREYHESFSRIPEAEAEVGDGKTVIFDIADYAITGLPEGQLIADLRDASLLNIAMDGANAWYNIVGAPKPSEGLAQVYRVTCEVRTLKKAFTRP